MRSDLIRLMVDTRRKELVTETNQDGTIVNYSTRERLGLHIPLSSKNEDVGAPHVGQA